MQAKSMLYKFFKQVKLKEYILKGGLEMFDRQDTFNEELEQAKNTLNIKKAKELLQEAQQEKEIKSEQSITEEDLLVPKSLEEARQSLEYHLIKEYLKGKEKTKISEFLETASTEEAIKERLKKVFLDS